MCYLCSAFSKLTERSVKLLAFCKEKLTKTDEQLVKLLDSLDN